MCAEPDGWIRGSLRKGRIVATDREWCRRWGEMLRGFAREARKGARSKADRRYVFEVLRSAQVWFRRARGVDPRHLYD